MSITDSHQVLENIVVAYPQITIWGAQTTLSPSDIKLGTDGEMPPAKLARLGNKYVVNPLLIKGFYAIRTRVRRYMEQVGIGFLGGYAVPLSQKDSLRSYLEATRNDFEQLRRDFLSRYDEAVEAWVSENPGYEQAIRDGAPEAAEVDRHFAFTFDLVQVGPCKGDPSSVMDHQVHGLSEKLMQEVNDVAGKLYAQYIAGKRECPSGTKKSLVNMRDKLEGLAFMNPDFDSLVALLNDAIDLYDGAKDRQVRAPNFHQLAACVLILSDRTRMEQYLSGAKSVKDTVAEKFAPVMEKVVSSVQQTMFVERKGSDPRPLNVDMPAQEVAAQDFYF